jgi:hypothetical protein
MPGTPKAKVKSRIVLTPQHAKRLVKALAENVHRFEVAHGEIKDTEQPPIPLNFRPLLSSLKGLNNKKPPGNRRLFLFTPIGHSRI